jgi:hypothetical protein
VGYGRYLGWGLGTVVDGAENCKECRYNEGGIRGCSWQRRSWQRRNRKWRSRRGEVDERAVEEGVIVKGVIEGVVERGNERR